MDYVGGNQRPGRQSIHSDSQAAILELGCSTYLPRRTDNTCELINQLGGYSSHTRPGSGQDRVI
jgi:hypothetical protein